MWSGTSTMTTSAWPTASATVATGRPSPEAAFQARESGRAPTTTPFPESWLLSAWAWPWLPYPITAIVLPDSAPGSQSDS
jgi:hypothetical protein